MARQPEETELPFKDYYQILQLHPETNAAMVDQAYWHLARLYNAATPSDPSARGKLDDLNEAYSVLRSPALRKAYDELRDAVLGEGALPVPPQPELEPPPLAVMEKQRPRSRKETKPQRLWRPRLNLWRPRLNLRRPPRLNLWRLSVPPWQSAASAVIMLALASMALATGAPPALVAALLVLGFALTILPLVRKLPRFPTLPTLKLHRLTLRAPRLPKRGPPRPSLDPDAFRQSTKAMLARWRQSTDAEDFSTVTSSQPHPPEQSSDIPTYQARRAAPLARSRQGTDAEPLSTATPSQSHPPDQPSDIPNHQARTP